MGFGRKLVGVDSAGALEVLYAIVHTNRRSRLGSYSSVRSSTNLIDCNAKNVAGWTRKATCPNSAQYRNTAKAKKLV